MPLGEWKNNTHTVFCPMAELLLQTDLGRKRMMVVQLRPGARVFRPPAAEPLIDKRCSVIRALNVLRVTLDLSSRLLQKHWHGFFIRSTVALGIDEKRSIYQLL